MAIYKVLIAVSAALAATIYASSKISEVHTEQARAEQQKLEQNEREARERQRRQAELEKLQKERQELEQRRWELARLEQERKKAEQWRKAEQQREAEQRKRDLEAQRKLEEQRKQFEDRRMRAEAQRKLEEKRKLEAHKETETKIEMPHGTAQQQITGHFILLGGTLWFRTLSGADRRLDCSNCPRYRSFGESVARSEASHGWTYGVITLIGTQGDNGFRPSHILYPEKLDGLMH